MFNYLRGFFLGFIVYMFLLGLVMVEYKNGANDWWGLAIVYILALTFTTYIVGRPKKMNPCKSCKHDMDCHFVGWNL